VTRQRRVAAGIGLNTGLSTAMKYVRRSCSSAECFHPDATAPRLREEAALRGGEEGGCARKHVVSLHSLHSFYNLKK
jgi:hypothetical protein